MRTLQLSYKEALSLARESRPLINPYPSFEPQLKIWEECEYFLYTHFPDPGRAEEKPAYATWKSERDQYIQAMVSDLTNQ